jgi:hypothetical protein
VAAEGQGGAPARARVAGGGGWVLKPGGGLAGTAGPQLGLDGQRPVGLLPPGHAPAQRTEQQHVGQHRQAQRAQLRGWLWRGKFGPIGAGGVHGRCGLASLQACGNLALRELAALVAGLELQAVLADHDLHDLVGLLGRLADAGQVDHAGA